MPNRSASGARGWQTVCDVLWWISLPERSLCRSRGVQKPVMPAWYEGSLCSLPVVQRVVWKPVVLNVRYGQPGRVLVVVQMKARCAGRDRVLGVVRIDAGCAGVVP